MKKHRRHCDKYASITHSELADVLSERQPRLQEMLAWLEAHLSDTERICVERWINLWWYVTVRDFERAGWNSIERTRVGFTFDTNRKRVMWVNDCSDNPYGGNCFVRSRKWKRLCVKRFVDGGVFSSVKELKSAMRWYLTVDPPKEIKCISK